MNDSGEIYIGYPVRTLYSEYLLSLGRDASLLLCVPVMLLPWDVSLVKIQTVPVGRSTSRLL